MKLSISPLIIALAAFLTTGASAEEKEPTAIVELGAGVSWDFPGGGSVGPTLGVEFTPIKDWLEIELGTGPFFGGGSTQWSTDALFKKPFTLSDTVEFMIGAGPEWNYTIGGGSKFAVELGADFMFWPWPDRKYGWFLEPSYSYGGPRDQSLGIGVGFLIAVR
jgi:hypothetical protein